MSTSRAISRKPSPLNSTITIRRAGPDDAPTLAKQRALLHCEVSSDEFSAAEIAAFTKRCEAFIRERLESGDYVAWVAQEDGAIIGCGGALFRLAMPSIAYRESLEVKIQSMYVTPERRGHGVGRRLLEVIVTHLRERDVERITLGPAPDALGFYEKMGFVSTPLMRL